MTTSTQEGTSERSAILNALRVFVRQRPGFEPGNYDSRKSYQSEVRHATQQLHDAETLLAAVQWRESIDADALRNALRAFSGRLTWTPSAPLQYTAETCPGRPCSDGCDHTVTRHGGTLDYCTGQYFPMEFRRAVCAVLSTALWDYWSSVYFAQPEAEREKHPNITARSFITANAKRELPRGVFARWFKDA